MIYRIITAISHCQGWELWMCFMILDASSIRIIWGYTELKQHNIFIYVHNLLPLVFIIKLEFPSICNKTKCDHPDSEDLNFSALIKFCWWKVIFKCGSTLASNYYSKTDRNSIMHLWGLIVGEVLYFDSSNHDGQSQEVTAYASCKISSGILLSMWWLYSQVFWLLMIFLHVLFRTMLM